MNIPRRAINIAIVITAFFTAFVPLSRSFVERTYSRFLYPHLQRIITPASNVPPFALLDVFAVAIIALWVVALMKDIRRGQRWKHAIVPALMRSIVWICGLYLAFVLLWGLNYRRVKLRDKLQVDTAAISSKGASLLAATVIDRLNAIYAQAHAAEPIAMGSIEPELASGFSRAQKELGGITLAVPGRPKKTLLNPFFHLTGVEGMTDPYFLETLIDDSVLPVERPFVIAHEWGHLAGFADESEANFMGWLACVHGSPADQYSGWLFAYEELMSAVPGADRADLVRRLAPGPIDDLRALVLRQQRQVSPRASRMSSQVYDRYLKANRIQSGVANYEEVVALMLGVQFDPDWTPKRKSEDLR